MSTPTRSIPAIDKSVLLALSDDVSADLLQHRMSRRGLHPVRVENGRTAMTKLEGNSYDLVVIEAHLPGLTGLELLQRVSTDDVLGSPLVVLLGANGNNEEVVRAFELGAADYIARPFAPEVALARILRCLETGSLLVSRPSSTAGLFLLPMPFSVFQGGEPFTVMSGIAAALFALALLLALTAFFAHIRRRRLEERRARLTSTWKTQLLRILAGDASLQTLVDRVDLSQQRLFLDFLIPYATAFDGREKTLIRRLATPFLLHIEDDLSCRSPSTRARAVQLFGLLGDDSCRGLLRRALDDDSFLVTHTAFRWLCRRGTPQDSERLLAQLDRLSRLEVNQLSSSLVHLGSDAAPRLRSYLSDPTQPTFGRVVCADALRWMGDGNAAALATQLLSQNPPAELSAALLRLLRRVGCPDHAALVRSYCESDTPFVRIHAARALGQIGDPQQDQNRLCHLVTDADSRWVAFNAAKSLTELGETTLLHRLSQTHHDRAPLAKSILQEPTL